jgi:hypothetical protein
MQGRDLASAESGDPEAAPPTSGGVPAPELPDDIATRRRERLTAQYSQGFDRVIRFGIRLALTAAIFAVSAMALAVVDLGGVFVGLRLIGLVVVLTGIALAAWIALGMVIMLIILDTLYYELRNVPLLGVFGAEPVAEAGKGDGGASSAQRIVMWIRVNADVLNLFLNALQAIGVVGAFIVAVVAVWAAQRAADLPRIPPP